MGGISFFGLIVVFLLVGIFVLLALVLILGRKGRATSPSCGQCGYAVAGLEILRCPECGSDLRQVGILTERMQRGLHPLTSAVLVAVGWSILLPIPALLITTIAFDAIPRDRIYAITTTLSDPDSKLYQQVTIDVTARTMTSHNTPAIPYQSGELVLTGNDGMDSPPLNFDNLPSLDTEQTAADLLDWMGAQNLNPSDAALARESDDLAAQLQRFAAGNNGVSVMTYQSVTSGSSINFEAISPWNPIGAGALWFVIWLVPIVWVFRRAIRGHRANQAAAR